MTSLGFSFTLEPLLKARRQAEQCLQLKLAHIERERLELEAKLKLHQTAIAESRRALRQNLVGNIQPDDLCMHAVASNALRRKAQQLALELAGVHRRLEIARAALIEAARNRRVVELLCERRFEEWKARAQRAETAATDEMAVIAAARTRFSHSPFATALMSETSR